MCKSVCIYSWADCWKNTWGNLHSMIGKKNGCGLGCGPALTTVAAHEIVIYSAGKRNILLRGVAEDTNSHVFMFIPGWAKWQKTGCSLCANFVVPFLQYLKHYFDGGEDEKGCKMSSVAVHEKTMHDIWIDSMYLTVIISKIWLAVWWWRKGKEGHVWVLAQIFFTVIAEATGALTKNVCA